MTEEQMVEPGFFKSLWMALKDLSRDKVFMIVLGLLVLIFIFWEPLFKFRDIIHVWFNSLPLNTKLYFYLSPIGIIGLLGLLMLMGASELNKRGEKESYKYYQKILDEGKEKNSLKKK